MAVSPVGLSVIRVMQSVIYPQTVSSLLPDFASGSVPLNDRNMTFETLLLDVEVKKGMSSPTRLF
jgi:hypothetical protein